MAAIAPLNIPGTKKEQQEKPAPPKATPLTADLPEVEDASEHMDSVRFVMCPPQYLSTRIKNNVWMSGEPVDVQRAMPRWPRTPRH